VLTGGGRMSKSMGNVMDPVATAERFGADALRYFLLREARFGRDFDFDHERLVARYNHDLANDLGNLLQRTIGMAMKYSDGELGGPRGDDITGLGSVAAAVEVEYRDAMEAYELQGGLLAVWKLISAGNLAVDTHKPWDLAKDPDRVADLDAVLSELAASLRQVAVMLYPFMPERTAAMAAALGGKDDPEQWSLDSLGDVALAPRRVHKVEALFPRIDAEEMIEGAG
jgi:methionyl-tRNA synthetase